jgi:hypothetical protein
VEEREPLDEQAQVGAAEAYLAAPPELAAHSVRLDPVAARLSRFRARVLHRPGAIWTW